MRPARVTAIAVAKHARRLPAVLGQKDRRPLRAAVVSRIVGIGAEAQRPSWLYWRVERLLDRPRVRHTKRVLGVHAQLVASSEQVDVGPHGRKVTVVVTEQDWRGVKVSTL